MQILVVSDSHSNIEALDTLSNMYPNLDLYLHAGDSEEDEFSIMPFRSVRGNCDYFSTYQESLIIPTPYGKLYMQHRPILSLDKLKKDDIKIFIHGHTHIRRDEEVDGIRILNPGAISFARDGHYLSYMILDIKKDKIKVEFKTLENKSVLKK